MTDIAFKQPKGDSRNSRWRKANKHRLTANDEAHKLIREALYNHESKPSTTEQIADITGLPHSVINEYRRQFSTLSQQSANNASEKRNRIQKLALSLMRPAKNIKS